MILKLIKKYINPFNIYSFFGGFLIIYFITSEVGIPSKSLIKTVESLFILSDLISPLITILR